MDKKEVVCSIDKAFLVPCGVMLHSLFEHHPRTSFLLHILHDLDPEEGELLFFLSKIEKAGHSYVLYKIDNSLLADMPLSNHASLANYYRLLIPDLLPLSTHRVLYLDSDMLIRGSMLELWDIELDGNFVAAVEQPHHDFSYLPLGTAARYFNSGVMSINLLAWRQADVTKKGLAFVRSNREKIQYWDQDVFNYLFDGKWRSLDSRWNHVSEREAERATVLHFAGKHKPWNVHCRHPYKHLYFIQLRKYLGFWKYKGYLLRTKGIRSLLAY